MDRADLQFVDRLRYVTLADFKWAESKMQSGLGEPCTYASSKHSECGECEESSLQVYELTSRIVEKSHSEGDTPPVCAATPMYFG